MQTSAMKLAIDANDDRPLIAHVIYSLSIGGLENGLVNLLNNLADDEFRHAIICVTESTAFSARIVNPDIPIFELKKRPGKDWRTYHRFWRLMKDLQPDVVHTRNIGTIDLAPIAALAGVRVRIHGEHGWHASDTHGKSTKYKLLRRICDPFVNRYVAVSESIDYWLRTRIGIKADKISLVGNGVDTTRFCPGEDAELLPFQDPNASLVIVGTVGRLDPIKAVEDLVEAFKRLLAVRPELGKSLRLAIVGDGPERHSLERIVGNAGIEDLVWIPGSRSDISSILREFDVFVLPSLNEGVSNTLLEAMATGLPAIATCVGGNLELVVDGETGFLVNARAPDMLADRIAQYADSAELRCAHGTAARARAVEKFSLDTMVARYEALYGNALGSREAMDRI